MPLRDHFRSPVNDYHSWDVLHGGWPMKIVEQLALKLPPQYVAGPQVHLGSAVEIDVGTFEQFSPAQLRATGENGGVATLSWTGTEPTLRVETEPLAVDEYEVRVYDVEHDRRLVAAIELVSPSNKDRPETRRAFVAKCAALLQEEVSVTMVDVVTRHNFNLYRELLAFQGKTDSSVADPPPSTYAAVCHYSKSRGRRIFEAWHLPLHVGKVLPELPIWLGDNLVVTLALEPCYEETCRILRIA